jgi:hypothetical protein
VHDLIAFDDGERRARDLQTAQLLFEISVDRRVSGVSCSGGDGEVLFGITRRISLNTAPIFKAGNSGLTAFIPSALLKEKQP